MNRRRRRDESLRRINAKQILFNERELKAIEHYCSRFKISNRSKFMREAIIKEVLQKFDENYPTLWEESQLSLF